jgi:hypothetical protein
MGGMQTPKVDKAARDYAVRSKRERVGRMNVD